MTAGLKTSVPQFEARTGLSALLRAGVAYHHGGESGLDCSLHAAVALPFPMMRLRHIIAVAD